MRTFPWRNALAAVAGVAVLPAGLALALAAPAAGATSHPAPHHSAGASPAPQASPHASKGGSGSSSQAKGAAPATAAAHGTGNGKPPASRKGDNGTVKIHKTTTPVTDPRNEPHVCHFYLDGFGFDAGQPVSWHIESWPPTGDRSTVSEGALAVDGNGNGHTPPMTLANGHYKLFWNFTPEHGAAKHKVFWVKCPGKQTPPPSTPPATPPGTTQPGPSQPPSPASAGAPSSHGSPPSHGGLPVTGLPLALIAGAGAVLLGTGGTALTLAARRHRWLRLR
ncbi:MAG: hypothetical protein LBI49_07430 [Nocardiopsaceae bacterium]|jgi:hypothetical protein|nr:hypothetical protein [Nocardiopsaceae bacterium]